MNTITAFISQNVEAVEDDRKVEKATEVALAETVGGALLLSGCKDWENMTGKPEGISHILVDLGSPVRKTFSSSSSMHAFMLTVDGKLYAMGQNGNGQLGLGDTATRTEPCLVSLPVASAVLKVACGRYHSLVLFESGEVWGCGLNKSGQLGLGDSKAFSGDIKQLSRLPLGDVVDLDAGYEHSIACTKAGAVFTWGSPQFGQLGHGTTGEYLKEGGKGKALQFNNVTTPKRVSKFITKDNKSKVVETFELETIHIRLVCAGKNHSLCVEDWEAGTTQNRVFSWGTGGYGRLAHNAPDDELYPREIIQFSPSVVAGRFTPNPTRQIREIVAGSTFTVAVSLSKQVYFWGKMTNSSRGEAVMYPKLVDDLYNWRSDQVACGSNLIVVAADKKLIAWGVPVAGLIGFEGGVKGSVTPKFLAALDGFISHHISCGYGHTCFVVSTDNEALQAKLDALPRMYIAAPVEKKTGGGKKRAPAEVTKEVAATGTASKKSKATK